MWCLWSKVDGFLHSHFKWNEAWNVWSPWFSLWDKHGSLRIFPLLLQFFELAFFNNRLSLLNATATPFAPDKCHAWPRPLHEHIAWHYQSPTERKSRWNNMARHKHDSISVSKNNFFFDSLVIIIQILFCWELKGELYSLATISDWLSNKKI